MRYLVYLVISTCVLSSCYTQRRKAESQRLIDGIKNEQGKEIVRLKMVDSTANVKLEQGKIDKNIRNLINNSISKSQKDIDSLGIDIASIETLLSDKKQYRKRYKSFITPFLDSLRKITFSKEKSSLYAMLEDGLNIADYKLFDLAAFFGPGIYVIPDEKKKIVVQSFAPIIDSLILFSNKYNQIPSTATLIVLGYADGTGFTDAGPLLDTLKILTGKTDPTKEELNQKLSELRAQELSKEFAKMFTEKSPSFISLSKFRINYINQGKGEEFPLPYIKDYKIEDDRRRIVLCYWAVLPD